MIPAVETRWKGRRFRSRTEARWAVFFAALEIRWEYERERFQLPSGSYLPDFYIHTRRGGLWAEVKGEAFKPLERVLCEELARETHTPCLLLDGPPDYAAYELVFPSARRRLLYVIRPTDNAHIHAVEAARAARFEGRKPKEKDHATKDRAA